MQAGETVTHLDEIVNKSIYILREVRAEFKNPCILWSTGKDSTTILSLVREAFFGEIPWDVVHIDTGWQFEEVYEFREMLQEEWGFNLVIAKSPLAGKINPRFSNISHFECCIKLKTKPLRDVIEKNGYDAVIVSIRRDEHAMRNIERVFSPRDREFRWRLVREKSSMIGDAPFESLQPIELWDLFRNYFKDAHHIRVHPILHWTEVDVWRYIKTRRLPTNPLYFSKDGRRFRSIGCKTCSVPIPSHASSIDEIIEEVLTSTETEREGRVQDKEEEHIMRRLRALGYM